MQFGVSGDKRSWKYWRLNVLWDLHFHFSCCCACVAVHRIECEIWDDTFILNCNQFSDQPNENINSGCAQLSLQLSHINYITCFFQSVDPSELQTNKQRKTRNHPAKTARETRGQDLWWQGKLNCTTGTTSYIKEDKKNLQRYKVQVYCQAAVPYGNGKDF